MERDDTDIWLRQLDYYAKLHQLNDQVGRTSSARSTTPSQWNDTVIIFTSDHGDQCGSHRLRSKGPWNYQETMRIPLYINAPGITEPGSKTDAMHVMLTWHAPSPSSVASTSRRPVAARRVADAAGRRPERHHSRLRAVQPGMALVSRVSSTPVMPARASSTAGTSTAATTASAVATTPVAANSTGDHMLFGRDAHFDDHDHELYDLHEDPHEMHNLAMDPAHRADLRSRFSELRTIEHETYANGF